MARRSQTVTLPYLLEQVAGRQLRLAAQHSRRRRSVAPLWRAAAARSEPRRCWPSFSGWSLARSSHDRRLGVTVTVRVSECGMADTRQLGAASMTSAAMIRSDHDRSSSPSPAGRGPRKNLKEEVASSLCPPASQFAPVESFLIATRNLKV